MPVPEPYAYVDPDWGPPASTGEPAQRTGSGSTDRRSGWLPLAASIMVTVLVAGGLFVATRAGGSAAGTAAATYLPADGSADLPAAADLDRRPEHDQQPRRRVRAPDRSARPRRTGLHARLEGPRVGGRHRPVWTGCSSGARPAP